MYAKNDTMIKAIVYLYRASSYATGQYYLLFYFKCISCVLSSIDVHIVILSGIFNTMVALFHHYLSLILVKGEECLSLCYVY